MPRRIICWEITDAFHFGSTFSRAKRAAARFRISFSISRVRLARRSRTSSARSSLVRPSLWPSSTSACRSQRCRHDPAIPRSAAKFGFEDGDGPNFTDEVAAAIEAAGPYRCRTQIWGLHNYGIEAIEEEVAPGEWVPVAGFDGYDLPLWESLPEPVRDALVALNDGEPFAWRL